jgi:hypothetical protein
MVEGHARAHPPSLLSQLPHPVLTYLNYPQNGTFQITQHRAHWNTQSRHTLRPQEMPPCCIGFRSNVTVVRMAIDFNCKLGGRTVEI